MNDRVIAVLVSVNVGLMLVLALLLGAELRELRMNQTPECFEDEAIVWLNDSHSLCRPIDDIVDVGIEYAIQNGVLEYSK